MPDPVQFLHDPATINPQSPAIVCITEKPADPAALTRQVISRYLNLPAATIHIAHDPHGRPFVQNHPASLSTSHSASLHAIALARHGRIGVDLELIDPTFDFAPIARDHFTPSENNWLNQLPPDQRPANFTRLWTAKEALLKALGLGLSLPMSQIEFKIADSPEPHLTLLRIDQSPALAANWQLLEHPLTLANQSFALTIALATTASRPP